ncbi:NAD-dependent malic enzyme [Halieaceae bacterium IMCC14734]|uniref:NAD-dependent malic enzyme n=1 Tax=Candidatus Litorirhabdus singularis TaxID=2518993 RepID=A0ABT3TJV0_9GAMM|nr:NAD-dependent malic enzyme [Candidatus Litorirhabdus singularis]MCX2982582.1 NAD-dependent malic enzyme [Candidatus Litorirhabdus singularis]
MDDAGEIPGGVRLLHDPLRNKGTSFTLAERRALGLNGLLPPRVHTLAEQERRVLGNVRSKSGDLERYLFLIALQDRNETLFYRVLMNHIEEIMPLIYTPTVGKACQEFGHIYRRPRGLYISLDDLGQVADVLANWPHPDVRVIVVTDGERILGLGDLGANGMGIPVGKLSLYTGCAGIAPEHCLPVTLDVGTNNESLLGDELYNGLEQRRERGASYDDLVAEFMDAAQQQFPGVLIQLEDFGNRNAFRLLKHYRDLACVFDDDIQGTGAVALAGLKAAMRISKGKLEHQRLLFYGAGQAGIGIGRSVVAALVAMGISESEARQCCWYFDSQGLLVSGRSDIPEQKQTFAHDQQAIANFEDAVEVLQPTALIGAAGQAGVFSESIIRSMAEYNQRPLIFALSNPTTKAECTAEQAYQWSDGRAVFASGSPFAPVSYAAKKFVSGQGNNAYIFPGVGLGVLASGSTRVTDTMFLAAANCLADQVTAEDLQLGRVYPPLSNITEVSALIAAAVAEVAWEEGVASVVRPDNPLAAIKAMMYQPVYPHYA